MFRRAITVLVPLLLTTLTVAGPATAAPPSPRYLNCAALPGAGTYANPRVIGAVKIPTVVRNCPPLSSGAQAVSYFRFNLPKQPSANSAVLTYYQLRTAAQSGVHPKLVWSPWTMKGSLGTGYLDARGYKGFYHPMADLWAGKGWLLGAEKVSSPAGSVQTAPYNVLVTP